MESPVVVDKPPEYHGGERGFPFDDEDEGRWSESFSARHPDIAAHLRHRPANWTSKRRPSSQDADDFADRFGTFDRLNFNDIPGFREHFPAEWNRRFGPREEPQPHPHPNPHPQQPQPQTSQSPPRHQTTATQTDHNLPEDNVQTNLPQYGLRNTVDLGQKSAADPSLVDAEDRNQRSMSAPPDSRSHANMSAQGHPEHRAEPQVVRQIPIQVEGRDKPLINTFVDTSTHFGDSKPYQPNMDRSDYFANDAPTGIHHPPNMQKSFGAFNKHGQQPTQPFSQQKMFPQSATRGGSPHRTQPPHPPASHAPHDHQQQQQQQPPADNKQPPRQPPNQPPPASPPPPETPAAPKPQPTPVDPITQILAIQTDVLNLMTDVEKFTGTKKDKNYIYLDEMLTRNLIKLDLIETDGKDNIRTARKEAIKCIQKCIAVLEAKAEKASQEEIKEDDGGEKPNGEVDMNETGDPKAETTGTQQDGDVAREEPAAPPLETATSVPEEGGSRSKKPATKGPNAREENPEKMQVEETVHQLDEAMEEDAPSQ